MMDLNSSGDSSPQTSCSICLEPVGDQRSRSIAKLHCGHDFHLDCIGSAFNAKGMMQCPNCRKVERGQWLYASGPNHNHSSSDDFDWIGDDIYDVTFAELPTIGFHWCPVRGFTQITSVIEQEEPQPYAYYDIMGNNSSMGGDHAAGSSSANSQNGCPYMAQHSMHAPSSSSASMDTRPIHESTTQLFHYRGVPAFSGAHPGVDLMNPHGFPAEIISTVPLAEHQLHQFGIRMPNNSRTDAVGPHRVPLMPVLPAYPAGPVPVQRNGNAVGSTVAIVPPPVAEVRSSHSRGSSGSTGTATGHIYQPALHANSPSLVTMRRVRPRGVTFFSSVSTTASTTTSNNADMGGMYSYNHAGSTDRLGAPESQNLGRHMDRVYAPPSREGPTQLPWIPLEGESQWWGPFNPTPNVQNLAGFGQRTSGERGPQGRSDNGYPPHMGPSRMPPPFM
ncbi:RING/U-box superfamily protein [Rhynchospora pubera]|uniref:RING/U-box superfamily protein n=1 Tax=Rhynchospora pubera TaxID=906938 RepID=A0AAV8CPI5_9POAL|nr:RING/U-box superfamily protein [Rhynchospora pubera]